MHASSSVSVLDQVVGQAVHSLVALAGIHLLVVCGDDDAELSLGTRTAPRASTTLQLLLGIWRRHIDVLLPGKPNVRSASAEHNSMLEQEVVPNALSNEFLVVLKALNDVLHLGLRQVERWGLPKPAA